MIQVSKDLVYEWAAFRYEAFWAWTKLGSNEWTEMLQAFCDAGNAAISAAQYDRAGILMDWVLEELEIFMQEGPDEYGITPMEIRAAQQAFAEIADEADPAIEAYVKSLPDFLRPQTCEHDWRVNPNQILTSNPPRQELVCAECGERSTRVSGPKLTQTSDPRHWPKAEA